ncbi:hypothetical protein GQ44DRAFT_764337 [Phaeosphaeriaceae sp. PMI808]|nr:hypothetical protein GQ44DRAFT_764337 [Phaeosphaeriaceae sp. PMI808]
MAPPAPPTIMSAYVSISPLEPVVVFSSIEEAVRFQSYCKQGRILPNARQTCVYLPMPHGLLRVRTAKDGDTAFDFDTNKNAMDFNGSILNLGRINIHQNSSQRTLYLGMRK